MPIVNAKPTAPTPVITNPPKVVAPEYKSPLVDTKYTPLSSLITFIEGYSWTVDYYSQVIGKDSALNGHDPSLPKQYQQYKLIKGLELKASSPISWSQDSVTKSIVATGESSMHSMLIPNSGDMFVADVGDGRLGVFQVGNTVQKSLLQQTVYSFSYTLIFFVDEQSNKKKDLDNKVVQELHYVRDFLLHGQNPLVTNDEFNAINKLQLLYSEIASTYMEWFYSRETRALLVPGQIHMVYDHFLAKFVNSILTTNDHPYVRQMVVLNVGDDDILKTDQLYDSLLNRNPRLLAMANRRMGVVSTKEFASSPFMGSIRMTKVDFVVYPFDGNEITDRMRNALTRKVPIDYVYEESRTRPGYIDDQIRDNVLDSNSRPLIHPIHKDLHYVFSKAFYEKTDEMSQLEILTHNYINDHHNSPIEIYKLAEHYHNWGYMERYYYLPILLCLIKSVIRRF